MTAAPTTLSDGEFPLVDVPLATNSLSCSQGACEECDKANCIHGCHLPEPDDWSDAEELASWVEDDTRARRRAR